MPPPPDADALLLLSLAVSSKRRPAELVEIIAAMDLMQEVVPAETRLVEAFARLAMRGLICAREGGFLLTPEAQEIMTGQSKKADSAQRLQSIRDKLSAYTPVSEHPPIVLTAKQVCAAILAHREAKKIAGKNLLTPKAKTTETAPRPGQRQRKPLPARRRKD